MDIFKGADNPFALFQRDSVSGCLKLRNNFEILFLFIVCHYYTNV